MTRSRVLDTDGDWQFGRGKNDYVQNLNAVSQNIGTRLRAFLGDCFFDETAGADWFNLLGAKDQTALKLTITTIILNTPNVTGLLQISLVYTASTRNFTVQYQVSTTYSVRPLSNTFTFNVL